MVVPRTALIAVLSVEEKSSGKQLRVLISPSSVETQTAEELLSA